MSLTLKISVFAFAALTAGATLAQVSGLKLDRLNIASSKTSAPWMSPEVGDAWRQGYRGQGTTISVVDQFSGPGIIKGNLNGMVQFRLHGGWTAMQASMIAPQAKIQRLDYTRPVNAIPLNRGLNVINASWGAVDSPGLSYEQVSAKFYGFKAVVDLAAKGSAVVAYATGNDAVATTGPLVFNGAQYLDYTSQYLRGTPSTIFVGALSSNGSVSIPAKLASYSSFPGADTVVQKQSLVVGVDASKNGNLQGTSFAAPIIAGYSAILGSKFVNATPTQVANQLLNTARRDTIAGYDVTLHGRGEASITRALAPASIR
jgi:hypothetical protein